MQETLFRAKRADNGEWVEGDLVHTKTTSRGVITEIYTLGMAYEVRPETVGQWIGVTDKNGKKIFAGDILQSENYQPGDEIGVVVHDDRKCQYWVHSEKYGWWLMLDETDGWEVLGNIHDNAKLLEDA